LQEHEKFLVNGDMKSVKQRPTGVCDGWFCLVPLGERSEFRHPNVTS